jgi:hypothetical protein
MKFSHNTYYSFHLRRNTTKSQKLLIIYPDFFPEIVTYFRGEVFWSAAEGFGRVAERDVFLAQAEVGDLDVAVLVQ